MLRFGGAGLASAVVDFATFAAAIGAGAPPAAANIGAFLVANAQSYVLNARLTFVTAGSPAPLSWRAYGRFLAAHLLSLAASTAIVAGLAPHLGPWPAKIVAALVAAAWNYCASHYFVFRGGADARSRSRA